MFHYESKTYKKSLFFKSSKDYWRFYLSIICIFLCMSKYLFLSEYLSSYLFYLCHLQELGTWKPKAHKKECGQKVFLESVRTRARFITEDANLGEFPYMAILGNKNLKWADIFIKQYYL